MIAHGTLIADASLGSAMKANSMTTQQTAATHHLDRMLAASVSSGGSTTATGLVFTRLLKAMSGEGDGTIEHYTITAPGATGECLVAFEIGASTPLIPAVVAPT